ncbi:MAG TPA: orotidine-5'-phosphate decarboxylase [Opitutaceae bacterium]|nr:orotidine-5'-phosphate decarboxylase [Opitutaceae bacterium]
MNCDLILALDCETAEEADPILRQLSGRLRWVKIGLQMFTAYGPDYVRRVADQGFSIFLDLKLHDIPNTVAKAVQSLAPLPIGMLTLHTCGGREMMEWAVKAQRQHKPDLLLLGVTVLTSMDDAALNGTGVPGAAATQVERLARLAASAGLSGLVCSPHEVAPLRAALPPTVQLVTPGVRPADAAQDEQKRVMTPADAARAGSNFIVVGRPILRAPSPADAATRILRELGR